jgi:hypothetical protein
MAICSPTEEKTSRLGDSCESIRQKSRQCQTMRRTDRPVGRRDGSPAKPCSSAHKAGAKAYRLSGLAPTPGPNRSGRPSLCGGLH